MAGKGKLVVISGPSGVGKSTIAREVLNRTGAAFSVSVTTRRPRPGEIDGRDYRFIDRPAFGKMIDHGELLEWAEVFGERYGTPAKPVRSALAAGETVLLDVDVQGAVQVHNVRPDATFVLIVPPDEDHLSSRLRHRGSEDPDSLRKRLEMAKSEIATARKSGMYNHVVVNDKLDRAVDEVCRIVQAQGGDEGPRSNDRPIAQKENTGR